MKTKQELTDILDFVAEYASYLLGSGVHTSRVIRNAQRIGTSQGVDIQLSSFQKSIIITVHDERSGEVVTRVVKIPALPISFERNSDLSALSWDAVDEHLSLTDLRDRYGELIAKPRMDPIFVLLTVGLANASFCRLFGGDWTAVGIVFTSTLVGFSARQRMQAHAVNHFLVFILSAFLASLCASSALGFDCTAEVAIAQRIGTSQGVDIQLSSFQKSIIITVHDERSGEVVTRVVKIPALPISFERNSDLSALSWDAVDEHLSLTDLRDRYGELIAKPRMDPIFVLLTVGLANASFCRLFGGDWTAVGIVFTSTLVGFSARQRMQAHAVNHFLVFILSAFLASLCASSALGFDCTAEVAIATSPLFLVPGVPLINGVIDIVEGHILIGCSRLINALLLIVCIAVGLSATLMIVKNSLL